MKLTKKLLALLLALVMLFALCACGDDGKQNDKDNKDNKDDKDEKPALTAATLVGDWEMTLDIGSLIASGAMGEDMPEFFTMMDPEELDLKMVTDVTFTEDGEMNMDPEGLKDFYTDMIDSMLDWLAEGDHIYEMMADEETSAEEYKAAIEAQGVTKEALLELVEESVASSVPDDDAIVEEMGTLYYELDGDTLYTWGEDEDDDEKKEEYMKLSYDGDTITVTKVISEGETFEPNAGDFVFEKK